MSGSREGAIARANACYDDGRYLAALRTLVAVPTESQMPQRLPDLYRYCGTVLPPMLAAWASRADGARQSAKPGRGPVLLATRIEDPALPTVLIYGHGDVVRGLAPQWTDGPRPLGGDRRAATAGTAAARSTTRAST